MNCPLTNCPGTITVFTSYDDLGTPTHQYFPCTECRGVWRFEKMPEVRNNVPCPKPGCDGSRADITITDENGNWIGNRSEACNKCGG